MPETTSERAEPYNYTYRTAWYATPEGPASARQRRGHSEGAEAAPEAPRVPEGPVAGAVPKNAVLYAILGVFLPGLPSLLIRDDKTIGAIQLVAGLVSAVLILFLIGFLLWPAVAIWSAFTGYSDAQLWNRRHGFVT